MNEIIMFWSNFVWEYFLFGSSRTVRIQTKIYFVAIPLTYQTEIPHPFVASNDSWLNLIVERSTFELARVLGLVVIRRCSYQLDDEDMIREQFKVPVGPVTRARAKKFKAELNCLIMKLYREA